MFIFLPFGLGGMLGNVSGEVLNPVKDKDDEDTLRRLRRLNLKVLNSNVPEGKFFQRTPIKDELCLTYGLVLCG